MKNSEKDVILIIADISGYTKFMIANKSDLVHAQMIVTALIRSIIKQVSIPLEISKIEGDAVFLYAVKDSDEAVWRERKRTISSKLEGFFTVFSNRVNKLRQSVVCECQACANIHLLKLKLIVHSGKALFYTVDKFTELSGVDVIILHRLLKNSVSVNEYILLTEEAHAALDFTSEMNMTDGEETYDDIGKIKTKVLTFINVNDTVSEQEVEKATHPLIEKVAKLSFLKFLTTLINIGVVKMRRFNNLPEVTDLTSPPKIDPENS